MKQFEWARIGGLGSVVAFLALSIGLFGTGMTRDVAVGRVEGTLTLDSSHKPFAKGTVTLVPAVQTPEGQEAVVQTIRGKANDQGRFTLSSVPEGVYYAESSGEAHSAERVAVHVREGKTSLVDVHLKPSIPGIDLYVNQHTFTPDERPEVYVHGLVPEAKVSVRVYPFTLAEAVEKGSVDDLVSPVSRAIQSGSPTATDLESRIQKYEVPLTGRDNEGVFHESVNLPPLPEGVYLLAVTAGKESRTNYVMVSQIALIMKSSGRSHLAYVTDIRTGQPVSGASVQAIVSGESKTMGETSKDGVLKFELAPKAQQNSDADDEEGSGSRGVIVAAKGDSRALTTVYCQNEPNRLRSFTKTDRPIYRPGDRVFFQGTLRKLGNNGYEPAGITQMEAEIRDPNDQLVKSIRLAVNSHGSYSGEFSTMPDQTGSYRIETKSGAFRDTYWVPIASYRKPEFRILVKPAQERTYVSEDVRAKVACSYYFGGPVVGAELRATVYRRPKWDTGAYEMMEYGEDEGSTWNGDYVGEANGTTNGQGEAELVFDPDTIEPDKPEPGNRRRDYEGDFVYTFEVSGTEAGDKYFNATGEVPVFAGDLSLHEEVDRWFMAPKETATVVYTVTDSATGQPISGKKITVAQGYERWNKNSVTFEPSGSQTVTTDANGEAKATITADRSGWLRIEASTTDRKGRNLKSESGIDVWSGASDDRDTLASLTIALDKKEVAAGGTVKALLRAAKPGGSALVTVEHDGIISDQVVTVAAGGSTVDLVIPQSALPNATIRAIYLRDKQIAESESRVSVPRTSREIKVEVQSAKSEYRPGETVDVAVKTRDAKGNPVAAEVSLGVVDEAVFAILEDRDSPVKSLYPYEYSTVVTSHSLVTLYLDGGSKEGKAAGQKVRQRFVDTAYWAPQVWTGDGGFARMTFVLPDNLTSFRTTATAITSDTRCGVGKQSFLVAKELMARITPPPAMVEGDQVRLTVGVNSRITTDTPIKVRLEGEGFAVVGEAIQEATVSRDKATQVPFTVRVDKAGRAIVRVIAEGGGYRDAMELPVTISARERVETTTNSQIVTNTDAKATLEGAPTATGGELTLTASASIAGPLLEGLDALIDYPYGCVEQTMSRFMPAVVVSQAVTELGLPRPQNLSKVPEIASRSLTRLTSMQHSDGGWGWWKFDSTSPEMTAIVLEGLDRARAAGVTINPMLIQKGTQWAVSNLRQAVKDKAVSGEQWRLAYALSRTTRTPEAVAALRIPVKDSTQLDRRHAILAWLALAKLGEPGAADEARKLWIQEATAKANKFDQNDYRFTELHARSLEILLSIGGSEEEIDREVQALVAARRGNQWVSTRDTAVALAIVAERLRAQKNASPSGEIIATVGDREVGRLAVNPDNFLRENLTVKLPLTTSDAVAVAWRATGTARFYTSAIARRTVKFESAEARPAKNLKISRSFHTLAAERQSDGTLVLQPSKAPLERFTSGEPMLCRVSIGNDAPLSRVLVVVPLPSNCRVQEAEDPESWNWWFSALQIFDDRVAFFIDALTSGSHDLDFHLTAETPGKAMALPASAEPMYFAGIQASSASTVIEVVPK